MLKEYGNDLQNGNIRRSIHNLPRERTIIGKNYFFFNVFFGSQNLLPRATTNKELLRNINYISVRTATVHDI